MSAPEPAPERLSPVRHLMPAGRHGRAEGEPVTILERRMRRVRVSAFRGRPVGATMKSLAGLDLPRAGELAAGTGGVRAVWLQPAVWLIEAPFETAADPLSGLASGLAGAAQVLDETDARTTFSIAGPQARDVLERLITIDLDPRAFGPGRTAVTPLGHVAAVLIATGPAAYDLVVPSTFAAAALHELTTAARSTGYVFS